jgi:hypothetical protein
MIKPIIKEGTKVVFGPCRLSYTHVFNKYNPDGPEAEGKFMTNVLIPKTEKETMPLRDGDEKDDENYEDHLFLNAKSNTRPGIVDKNKVPIVDEEEVYSGVWAIISVTFFAYDKNGNRGIACGLNNIMKFKDDDRFGGRVSAESDFGDVDLPDDDEDL